MAKLEILHKASDLIKRSKRTLFLTSAGMSADSNIPTFRDKDAVSYTHLTLPTIYSV